MTVDVELMWELFARFVVADTGARIGENRIDPQDARMASFAADVAAPTFRELGADVSVDELNNVVGRFGEDRGTELLFVSYPALHHSQEMDEPLRARREVVDDDEWWVGLGASQGKAALAAVCAAVRILQEQGVELSGRVTLAVCSEGSSSHVSSRKLYEAFSRLPIGAVLTVGTQNRITLGNRGRVDVVVDIPGRATHSSSPESGENPIPIVAQVLERIAAVQRDAGPYELLGPRAVVPYKLVCGPVAPHTIPASCTLVLDCRTLPGDDEDAVVAAIAEAMADLAVDVRKGASMLPALVDESSEVVVALQAGAHAALGHALETTYPRYTFDAGYGCSIGVPTVMLGPSPPELADVGVLGQDRVLARHVRELAAMCAGAIARALI